MIDLNINKIELISNTKALEGLNRSGKGVLIYSWNKLIKRVIIENIRCFEGKLHEDNFIAHRILYSSKKIIYHANCIIICKDQEL